MLAMARFLLEIGTEELPASVQQPAAAELERRIRTLLAGHGIAVGTAELFYTPRRIAVRLADVPPAKPAAVVEVQGPPKKAAYDASGNPTRTALGFSAAQGCKPEDLYVKTTPRGNYVFARKTAPEVPTGDILAQGLPEAIRTLPFPRPMRWTAGQLRFARPVRWLLCLLGDAPLRFELDSLVAQNATFGHRNFTTGPARVGSADRYEQTLARLKVIPDPTARRTAIATALSRLAAEVNGLPVVDQELLSETVGITEYPELIRGSFQPEHLDLPAEVIITALKKHQRCFCIRRTDGSALLPVFIAATNTPDCDGSTVAAWYEKAVESRLKDARFFFAADMKRGLLPLVEEERRVVWIEGMGSYYDKTERLRALCRHLAGAVPSTDAAALDRAALLSKTDLLTDMVREKEFTSLQGRMGGIYARLLGEPEPVAAAIAEHYLPGFAGDALPSTLEGALLSVADKLDNIVATFLTGAIPSGSEDPFALRRQAAGLLAIIQSRKLDLDLSELLDTALRLFPDHKTGPAAELPGFLRERVAALIADTGTSYDIAAAVMETSWTRPILALARSHALEHFRAQPEFEKLIIGQKRVANILKKETVEGRPKPDLFRDEAETLLWQQTQAVEPDLVRALDSHDYDSAFSLLLGLRPVIDRFFDEVLVMDEDPCVRQNRLYLLACVRSLFARVADLSRIVLEGGTA
jgi:glycyl-tRNA synthetase beta chain